MVGYRCKISENQEAYVDLGLPGVPNKTGLKWQNAIASSAISSLGLSTGFN